MTVKDMTKRSQRVIVKFGEVEYKHDGVWFVLPQKGRVMPFSAEAVQEMQLQGFDFSVPELITVEGRKVAEVQQAKGSGGAIGLLVKN